MLHKFRLLFIPVLATLFLAACESETDNQASTAYSSVQKVTTASDESNAEATVLNETIETDDSQTEEALVEESEKLKEAEDTEETQESERVEEADPVEEPVAVEPADPEEAESLNSAAQEAVDQLIEETDIELENYVFFFTETEEFVEIEVRENIDADATPLVGIYRYMMETDELLVNDYLTGEYIPFEKIQ